MGWGYNIPLLKLGRGRYSVRVKLTRRGIKTRARAGWFWWGSATRRRGRH